MDFASLNNDRGKVFVDVTYENALLCAGRLSEEYVAGGETLAELRETGQRLERAVKVAWKKVRVSFDFFYFSISSSPLLSHGVIITPSRFPQNWTDL